MSDRRAALILSTLILVAAVATGVAVAFSDMPDKSRYLVMAAWISATSGLFLLLTLRRPRP